MPAIKKTQSQMIKQRNNLILVFICLLCCLGCDDTSKQLASPKRINRELLIQQQQCIDSARAFLKNGNIVLRTGNDVISAMFAQLNKTDQTFSHCGIAFQEDSIWWVYHSIGGEDNPDAKLRRETFERFVSKDHNLGLGVCEYPITTSQIESLHQVVQSFHQQQVPFDMQFDLKSNDRFYCAEMVYKAYSTALHMDSFFNVTNHKGFVYVSTDNIFTSPNAKLKCHFVYPQQ
jgi:hypothetical protein